MLFLVFRLGKECYALDATRVIEVLPLVEVRPVPHAPPGVSGVFEFRGQPVPVIDLSLLTLGRPAQQRLSTRLVVVDHATESGDPCVVGLIAERATETARRASADFMDCGINTDGAPYLGPVTPYAGGLMQRIDVRLLLPEAVREALCRPRAEQR